MLAQSGLTGRLALGNAQRRAGFARQPFREGPKRRLVAGPGLFLPKMFREFDEAAGPAQGMAVERAKQPIMQPANDLGLPSRYVFGAEMACESQINAINAGWCRHREARNQVRDVEGDVKGRGQGRSLARGIRTMSINSHRIKRLATGD